jgi:predicted nucleotidyltransferase
MTREELIAALRPLLSALPQEVVSVYLFGSFARSTARAHSDVDLAFWRRTTSEPTVAAQPYELEAQLEREVGREVDLIELNRASPELIHHVLRDGVLPLDRDREFRVRCEVQARASYLDLLPVLRHYRKAGGSR